ISTLALVAGLGFSGTTQAFNVYEDGETYFDLYGRIHLTLNNDDGNDYISEEGSRLGFKAGHRINPKLEGFIRAEFRFTANDRDEARPNVIDDIRNTYVGLRFEDVGAVKVG
ncbi:porin, partial [Guyparkeria sp. 1SP6A2]|nr:porin [Guyparkeria sp. 1SP6A2]